MTINLTWTPGAGATSQTIQYKSLGEKDWTNYQTINNNTTSSAVVTLPDGAYDFRIENSCSDCLCPQGYTKQPNGDCTFSGTLAATLNTSLIEVARMPYHQYGNGGTKIYNAKPAGSTYSLSDPFTLLDTANSFWTRIGPIPSTHVDELTRGPVNRLSIWGKTVDNNGNIINNYNKSSYGYTISSGANSLADIVTVPSTTGIHVNMIVSAIVNSVNLFPDYTFVTEILSRTAIRVSRLPTTPLVNTGLTTTYNHLPPLNEPIGFTTCIDVPATKTYHIAIAGDNQLFLKVNGTSIFTQTISTTDTFNFLHVFPIELNAGMNVIELLCVNELFNAGFGCEIFDLSNRPAGTSVVDFLNAQTNYDNLTVLFTTRNVLTFTSNTYVCPTGFTKNTQTNCTSATCTGSTSVPCTPVESVTNVVSAQIVCNAPSVSTVILEPEPAPPPPPPQSITTCLDGLTLEFLYFGHINDLQYLPAGYTLPCTSQMFSNGVGVHTCNRAFFEVFMGGVYVGDALMNNHRYETCIGPGAETRSGLFTCTNYLNTPDPDLFGVVNPTTGVKKWMGTENSRYSRIVITSAQAQAIAAQAQSNSLPLSLTPAMTTYNQASCMRDPYQSVCHPYLIGPHTDVTWFRVTKPDPSQPNGVRVLYNGCPRSYATTIEVCETTTTNQ